MKYLKTFEEIDIEWDEEEFEEEWEEVVLNGDLIGKKVLCIKDCINTGNNEYKGRRPVKKGEIKIVAGLGTKIWFKDTPNGWGAYEKENFVMA